MTTASHHPNYRDGCTTTPLHSAAQSPPAQTAAPGERSFSPSLRSPTLLAGRSERRAAASVAPPFSDAALPNGAFDLGQKRSDEAVPGKARHPIGSSAANNSRAMATTLSIANEGRGGIGRASGRKPVPPQSLRNNHLSPRQQECLDALIAFQRQHGRFPKRTKELPSVFRTSSSGYATFVLRKLEQAGAVRKQSLYVLRDDFEART